MRAWQQSWNDKEDDIVTLPKRIAFSLEMRRRKRKRKVTNKKLIRMRQVFSSFLPLCRTENISIDSIMRWTLVPSWVYLLSRVCVCGFICRWLCALGAFYLWASEIFSRVPFKTFGEAEEEKREKMRLCVQWAKIKEIKQFCCRFIGVKRNMFTCCVPSSSFFIIFWLLILHGFDLHFCVHLVTIE